jgi:hypothetical protein
VKTDSKYKSTLTTIVIGAKNGLVAASFLILFSLILLLGLNHVVTINKRSLEMVKSNRDEATKNLERLKNNNADFDLYIEDWKRWNSRGLIGNASRAEWFETASNIQLPGAVKPELTLEMKQSVPNQRGAYSHELIAEFKQVTETEALQWMNELFLSIQTYGRVDSVTFDSPDDNGITARLHITLFNLDPLVISQEMDAISEVPPP